MLVRDVIVLISIHVVANGRSSEKLDKIGKAYEEASVFAVLAIYLFPRLPRPLLRFITPVAGPLLHAVWIANLYQTVLVQVCIRYNLGSDQRVGMAVLQAVFLELSPRHLVICSGIRTATHGHFLLISCVQAVPKAVHIGYLVVVKLCLWAACEWIESLAGRAGLNPLVAAKDLGPGLLDDQYPDLLRPIRCIGPRWLRKRPSSCLVIIREVVVNDDGALFPIDIHCHSVAARFIHLVCQENALNSIRMILGQGAQTCQKVAISASTLFNVIGPWFGIYNEVSLSVFLNWSLPRECFPSLVARILSYVTVKK